MKIAVATSDGKTIDQHFGHAETLTVYSLSESGAIIGTEQRPGLGSCVCKDDSGHDEEAMRVVFESLSDCRYLLVKRIGPHMVRELAAKDVVSFELFGELAPTFERIIKYEHKQQERRLAKQASDQQ